MRALDGTGLAKRLTGGRSRGARRGPLAAALLGLSLLCCLFGAVAPAGAAAPPDFSAQAQLARLALQQAQLTADNGAAEDLFGCSVAIFGDTALVGAQYRATGRQDAAGAAYVFTRSGGSWAQQQTLTATDGVAFDAFGYSVAIFGDTALVSAPFHDTAGEDAAGAAYVFTRSGGAWTQQAKLTAGAAAAGDRFGYSVAIFGETALLGAPFHDTAGRANAGAACLFARSGGVWTPQQTLTVVAAAGDQFGYSVALAEDTALLGAPFHDTAGEDEAGAVGDRFGSSVALAEDTALLGAPLCRAAGKANAGAAYVFTRSGGAWPHKADLIAGGAFGDQLGSSVALAEDTALLGAPFRDTAGKEHAGAAYVFLTAPSITRLTPTSGPVGTAVTLTGTGFSGATAVTFTGAAAIFSVDSATHITTTVPSGATSGPIAVTTPDGTVTSAVSFTVIPAPSIAKLRPASAERGATVTIRGSGFRATRGAGFVKFGARKCAMYLSWSNRRIKCKVPAKARYGGLKVRVTTAGGTSNSRSFRVKR